MTKQKPRNPMDSQLLLHRHAGPVPEDAPADPDVKHLNGREIAEHEVSPVLAARRAEREEAAGGILSGLIRKPKILGARVPWRPVWELRAGDVEVPADEGAQDAGPVLWPGDYPELFPQPAFDAERGVGAVGVRLGHTGILPSVYPLRQRNSLSPAVHNAKLCVSSPREGKW